MDRFIQARDLRESSLNTESRAEVGTGRRGWCLWGLLGTMECLEDGWQ